MTHEEAEKEIQNYFDMGPINAPYDALRLLARPVAQGEAREALAKLKNVLDGLSWYSADSLQALRASAMEQLNAALTALESTPPASPQAPTAIAPESEAHREMMSHMSSVPPRPTLQAQAVDGTGAPDYRAIVEKIHSMAVQANVRGEYVPTDFILSEIERNGASAAPTEAPGGAAGLDLEALDEITDLCMGAQMVSDTGRLARGYLRIASIVETLRAISSLRGGSRPMMLKAEMIGGNLVVSSPKEGCKDVYVGTICSLSLTKARAEEIVYRINAFESLRGGKGGAA